MALFNHGKPGPSSAANSVQHFDGRHLAYALRGKTAAARARLAATCTVGIAISHPTDKQRAALFRVSAFRLNRAHSGNKKRNGNGRLAEHPINADAEVDRLIRKYGADVIMRGLDRYTQPRFQFAAE
jgi:hypothetical protein